MNCVKNLIGYVWLGFARIRQPIDQFNARVLGTALRAMGTEHYSIADVLTTTILMLLQMSQLGPPEELVSVNRIYAPLISQIGSETLFLKNGSENVWLSNNRASRSWRYLSFFRFSILCGLATDEQPHPKRKSMEHRSVSASLTITSVLV